MTAITMARKKFFTVFAPEDRQACVLPAYLEYRRLVWELEVPLTRRMAGFANYYTVQTRFVIPRGQLAPVANLLRDPRRIIQGNVVPGIRVQHKWHLPGCSDGL